MPWGLPDSASNIAIIVMDFMDPPLVTVKEEYLVYDGVALISSVGGLLGICVGVSFHCFSSGVFNLFSHTGLRYGGRCKL